MNNLTNSTSSTAPSDALEWSQPVTGPSVLWALIALALTAVSQQSVTAGCWSESADDSDDSFCPWRVSPVICLQDAIQESSDLLRLLRYQLKQALGPTFELVRYLLLGHLDLNRTPLSATSLVRGWVRRYVSQLPRSMADVRMMDRQAFERRLSTSTAYGRDREDQTAEDPLSERKDSKTSMLCARFILFLLGALPQALKLFSYQGISFAQACAAVYLTAIVLHGLHCLLCRQDREKITLGDQFKRGDFHVTSLMHYILYGFIWFRIAMELPAFGCARPEMLSSVAKVLQLLVGPGFKYIVLFLVLVLPSICIMRSLPYWFWLSIQVCYCFILLDRAGSTINDCSRGGMHNEMKQEIFRNVPISFFLTFGSTPLALVSAGPAVLVSFCIAAAVSYSVNRVSSLDRSGRTVWTLASNGCSVQQPRLLSFHYGTISPDYEMIMDAWRMAEQKPPLGLRIRLYICRMLLTCSFAIYGLTPLCVVDMLYSVMQRLEARTRWMTFLVFHILTVSSYYAAVFDGERTINPGWTYILG